MALGVRPPAGACEPGRSGATNTWMLTSPRVSKARPTVTLGLAVALSLSLPATASAFVEEDVPIPSGAYSVGSSCARLKQEPVCSKAAILFDVAEEPVLNSCPEFSGPRYIAALQREGLLV